LIVAVQTFAKNYPFYRGSKLKFADELVNGTSFRPSPKYKRLQKEIRQPNGEQNFRWLLRQNGMDLTIFWVTWPISPADLHFIYSKVKLFTVLLT